MASRPVPAEGSSTTIGRRDRGRGARRRSRARSASRTAEAPALSSERRVWVGRRPAILASIGSMRGRRRGARAHGRAELAQEQDGRRLAGVVGRLPVPGAGGVGGAEGVLHGGAQASARRCGWPRSRWGRRSCAALAIAAASSASWRSGSGAAATAAAEAEMIVMEETSGERERAEPPGALSTRRLKPVPAVLSLSST